MSNQERVSVRVELFGSNSCIALTNTNDGFDVSLLISLRHVSKSWQATHAGNPWKFYLEIVGMISNLSRIRPRKTTLISRKNTTFSRGTTQEMIILHATALTLGYRAGPLSIFSANRVIEVFGSISETCRLRNCGLSSCIGSL